MNIVWDFGGVLFRWRPAELLAQTLPARVTDEASARHWQAQIFQHYSGDWGEFDRGTVQVDELIARITARTGLAADEVQAVIDGIPDELSPIAPSVALLEALRERGHRLFYLSNMPAPMVEHLERSHDFLAYFEDGVFSSRVNLIKPEAEVFRLAQQRFGIPAQELVFLDDYLPNVQAAQAQGWQAMHFTDAASAQALLHEQSLF
jgi:HAD superfamily hydrolase (TIGR01509 family)